MDNIVDNSTTSLPNLYIMMLCFAVLSFFVTISLLLIVGLARVETSYIFILVTNIIIANLIHIFSYIFNWVLDNGDLLTGEGMCQVQAIFMIWSSMSQELWISVFVCVVYLMLSKGIILEKKKLFHFVIYYLLCVLLPLIISLVFYFCGILGKNSHYCWVEINQGIAPQIIIYGMRYINFIFNVVFTIFILKYLCSLGSSPILLEKGRQFISYPIIQILGMILPSLNRFQPLVKAIGDVLTIPALISVGLQGVLFPICFGWYSNAYYLMKTCCNKEKAKKPADAHLTDESLVDDLSSI